MSAIYKGFPAAVLTRRETVLDAQTKEEYFEDTYQGTPNAILSKASEWREEGISYRANDDEPRNEITGRIPIYDPSQNPTETYEITTESTEKSLFELPQAIIESLAFDTDLARVNDEITYKKAIEDEVDTPSDRTWSAFGSQLIRSLRAGVTGWQIDLVVLRRVRRVPISFGISDTGKIDLDDGLVYFSTVQLAIPGSVAFALPDTPDHGADFAVDYQWGWRKRTQCVEFVGQWIEQRVELLFAPWAKIAYSASTEDLAW